ncbi:hypothetical protein FXO37_06240 [Capsicum annuum]|nr:hypothetical protein FXO37_06240 [Capsicum annuum]
MTNGSDDRMGDNAPERTPKYIDVTPGASGRRTTPIDDQMALDVDTTNVDKERRQKRPINLDIEKEEPDSQDLRDLLRGLTTTHKEQLERMEAKTDGWTSCRVFVAVSSYRCSR